MGKWGKEKKRKGKGKKRKWVTALGFGLGHENGGERWAMMGWNWSWAERNGLGQKEMGLGGAKGGMSSGSCSFAPKHSPMF